MGLPGTRWRRCPLWLPRLAGQWEERRLRAFLVAPPVPSAWPLLPSPFLSSPPIRPRAPAYGRFQKTRRAGAAASRTLPGEGTISPSPPWRPRNLEWATRFERSCPALGSARPALQPQPRVCSMWHLGRGSRPAAGALGFTKWVAGSSRRLLSHKFLGLSHYYSLQNMDIPLGGILPGLRSDNLQLNIACVGEDMPYLGHG